jgi:hypothetical protein
MYCARHISGIIFIRYAQNPKIGKPNNLKKSVCMGAIKPKRINRIAKIG